MEEVKKGHPKGLYLLFFTEMWERFSYYGMRAIFTLYMLNGLLFDKALTSSIYGSFTGLVYLTPLIGGYIADRYWGNRRSIIVGGFLMALGQLFMFVSGSLLAEPGTSQIIMYGGLGFLIIGNGFFKPNISTMVGSLYTDGDRRVDSAFTIFYMGINMGAMIAPFVCGTLGEQYDADGAPISSAFKWGFLAACIGMVISLIAFIALKNKYVVTPEGKPVGIKPEKKTTDVTAPKQKAGISTTKIIIAIITEGVLFALFNQILGFDFIGSLIFSFCLVLPGLIISDSTLTAIEKSRIWVIYIIAFFVIFFWSAFEQAGASLTFFAQEQTDRNVFGWNMPASLFQIFNALFIVVLAPLAVTIWSFLGKRKLEPASPVKQAMGLGLLALGYLFIAWGVNGIQPWDKVSMIWLVGLYLIHTIGELCLSPIGLSMVVKLAPARIVSLLMGVWFMSTATANKFAGELSALYPEDVKLVSVVTTEANLVETVKANEISKETFEKSAKDTIFLATASFSYDAEKDTILEFKTDSSYAPRAVSMYPIKLIKTGNGKFSKAVMDKEGKYLLGYKQEEEKNKDGSVTVLEKVEIYDLQPKRPSFLGMEINNLFDFFMIFVYMAGAASIILLIISKLLLKMMHGVR